MPDPDLAPGDAATIVFTSGTTGRPKGSVSDHRGVLAQGIDRADRDDPARWRRLWSWRRCSISPGFR
ncbi:MAG: AMP-binding protein [Sphingomonadales bacterium]|nr:AMP-binding protein [Sphingomonadales bacterium]